jgi:hypothetical protein
MQNEQTLSILSPSSSFCMCHLALLDRVSVGPPGFEPGTDRL